MILLAALIAISAPGKLAQRVVPVMGNSLQPIAAAVPLTKRKLLTAAHVVGDNGSVLVRCAGMFVPGNVTKVGVAVDLALIELDRDCDGVIPSQLGAHNSRPGDELWLVGFPLRDFAVKHGVLSRYGPAKGYQGEVQIIGFSDAEALPGNSGGAALDSQGFLVGIVVSRLCMVFEDGTSSCLSGIVPLNVIQRFLEQ
jgi:S1-C subfamily serine protease